MLKVLLISWILGLTIFITLGCGNAAMARQDNENFVQTASKTDTEIVTQLPPDRKFRIEENSTCTLVDVETTLGKFLYGMHGFQYEYKTVPCEEFKTVPALSQSDYDEIDEEKEDVSEQFFVDDTVVSAFSLPIFVDADECLTPCKNDGWNNGTFFPKNSLVTVFTDGVGCSQSDSFFYRSWGLLCYMGEPSLYGNYSDPSIASYRFVWSPLGAPITESVAVRLEMRKGKLLYLLKRWGSKGTIETSYGKVSQSYKARFDELLDDSKFWQKDSVLLSNSVKDGLAYLIEARVGDRYHLVWRKNNADVNLMKLLRFVHALKGPNPV